MSMTFTHETLGQRVLFGRGRGAENLRAEVDRLGASRVMLIASEREADLAARVKGDLPVVLEWEDVRQHVPVESAARARAAAAAASVDAVVAVGGGSTTGLAKAVALTTGLPIIAVPTTYAGSEATNVWGMTEDETKTTGVDARVLPVSVVYDSDLTMSLPVGLSVASGLNGLAHCVDSLWAPRADPINRALALEGARALASALRGIVADSQDGDARDEALYGCYLAAVSFASAGSGLHHKACHVLGGTFDLPHAQTHATMLPYVLAFNAPSVPEVAGRLANALGHPVRDGEDAASAAVAALNALRAELDAPTRLSDYGFTEAGIPEAVRRILAVVPESNPTPATKENLTALLSDALTGAEPRLRG